MSTRGKVSIIISKAKRVEDSLKHQNKQMSEELRQDKLFISFLQNNLKQLIGANNSLRNHRKLSIKHRMSMNIDRSFTSDNSIKNSIRKISHTRGEENVSIISQQQEIPTDMVEEVLSKMGGLFTELETKKVRKPKTPSKTPNGNMQITPLHKVSIDREIRSKTDVRLSKKPTHEEPIVELDNNPVMEISGKFSNKSNVFKNTIGKITNTKKRKKRKKNGIEVLGNEKKTNNWKNSIKKKPIRSVGQNKDLRTSFKNLDKKFRSSRDSKLEGLKLNFTYGEETSSRLKNSVNSERVGSFRFRNSNKNWRTHLQNFKDKQRARGYDVEKEMDKEIFFTQVGNKKRQVRRGITNNLNDEGVQAELDQISQAIDDFDHEENFGFD